MYRKPWCCLEGCGIILGKGGQGQCLPERHGQLLFNERGIRKGEQLSVIQVGFRLTFRKASSHTQTCEDVYSSR